MIRLTTQTSPSTSWKPIRQRTPHHSLMSDLFETQNEVTQDDCVAYAGSLVGTSVKPVPWQGFHSYTLVSETGLIVQFRSNSSPLDISMTALAKAVHRHVAPATSYYGLMPDSSMSIWIMEALPGTGYLFTFSSITVAKLDTIVIDMAKWVSCAMVDICYRGNCLRVVQILRIVLEKPPTSDEGQVPPLQG